MIVMIQIKCVPKDKNIYIISICLIQKIKKAIFCNDGNLEYAKIYRVYYLMYISTRLIHCSSLSHCIYYKPSVNYHDSADSLDKINSIINCVENGENVFFVTKK